MARLHPSTEKSLALLPQQTPLHLFTRHSVRELAKNGFADYRLPLTEQGVQMAIEWGASLGRPVASFHSSPVARCVDTAKAMATGGQRAGLLGADLDVSIETVTQLVEPGCYVQDMNQVGPLFLKLGALGFLNLHISEPIDGLLSPEHGRIKLLNYLYQRDPDHGQLAVHVTHDTILMALVAELLGLSSVDESQWPWMMEGMWLWFDDMKVHWVWRGEANSMPFDPQ